MRGSAIEVVDPPLRGQGFAGDAAVIQLAPTRRPTRRPSRRCRRRLPTGRGSSHFGHHSGASIGDCDRRVGLMIGTAITKVLRGPGAALSILVLCATPAAAQYSFPFSPPPPPSPVPAPIASPAPNAGARSQ